MKFKVGDKVRVRSGLEINRTYANEGGNRDCYFVAGMENYRGKEATITGSFMGIRYSLDIDGGRWYWVDEMLEPVLNKIVITTDGKEISAALSEGDEVICGIMAKRSSDFLTDAKLALDRLIREKKNKKHEIKVGDIVKVINNGRSYTTYGGWFKRNAPDLALYYSYNHEPNNGAYGEVVKIGEGICAISVRGAYDIKSIYLINEKGIKKVEG